jgi:CRISPR-associated protein Csx17
MNRIRLEGCTPEPLGSYLKALAVLRLVAEQADPLVRGWWAQDCFCLETELDENALVEFFLKRYAPTPILSPWNGGSGFYPKDRKIGIDAIAASAEARFEVYRAAINGARTIVAAHPIGDKSEEDARRKEIQLKCRNQLPDGCVDWLDAAVGIDSNGDRSFAPVLGTGGNEGRLDYTNNLMEYLAELLIQSDSKTPVEELLRNALFGTATSGLQPSAVGQYDPGRAGGFNQGQGVETADFPSNPWNFVLTLEGGVAWAAGLYRRQGVAFRSFLCSPFTVRSTPVGYGSAAEKDREASRAEIWAPVWERPATYREIRAILREGRAAVDGRPAKNGLEFAEAACLLGVDRGISGFVRYNLLKRRGDSYVALPAGRFGVNEQRREGDLVRELNSVLDEFDQMKSQPAEFTSLRRQIDDAMYAVLLRGGTEALLDLAVCVGRLNRWIVVNGKEVWNPSRISGEWVDQLAGTSEARIAAALASMYDRDVDQKGKVLDWSGANLEQRMAKTLQRRMICAEQSGLDRNPLGARYKVSPRDVSVFLEEGVDDERIEDLLFAFLLVDWKNSPPQRRSEREQAGIWPLYALLKYLFLAEEVETRDGKRSLMGDLGVLAALTADDVARAGKLASRRLQNVGMLNANIEDGGGFRGTRMAGALLIPVVYGPEMQQFFMTKTGDKQ